MFVTASRSAPPEIQLFGPPAIEVAGAPVMFDTRKATALLAYLAATGTSHTRDRLAALLWPESDATRSRAALRRTLSTIRSAAGPELLVTEGDVVALARPAGETSDLGRLRRALDIARRHDHDGPCESCRTLLAEATPSAGGVFMDGFSLRDAPDYDDWQVLEGESVRRELGEALDLLSDLAVAAGDAGGAIAAAERRLAVDPLHEPTHRRLMDLQSRSGDRSGALRRYRRCVEVLDRELGVPPSEATNALYQEIAGSRQDYAAAEQAIAPPPLPSTMPPRAGSADALNTLVAALRSGMAAFWGVEGEPGSGKTRLIDDVVAELARDRPVSTVRCHSDESRLAFGLVGDLIGLLLQDGGAARLASVPTPLRIAAATVLPEIGEPDAAAGANVRDLRIIYEAIASVLSAAALGPGSLLVIDDLDRADPESLDVLTYITRRPLRHPLAVLATWTDSRSGTGARLSRLAAMAADRGQGGFVRPALLAPTDIAGLAATITGQALAQDDLDWLVAESNGLPLLAIEGARALDSGDRPGSIRDLLMRRLQGIDDVSNQVLTAAAVAGPRFEFDLLVRVSGRSEVEVVEAVEELQRRGIFDESDGGSYTFAHDGIRTMIYEGTGKARRRLLHRRSAAAIEIGGRPTPSRTGLAAQHMALAGLDEEAAVRFVTAGDAAAAMPGSATAIEYWREALALGYGDPARLHERIADVQVRRGAYGDARVSYETALARTAAEAPGIEHKLGRLHSRRGDWDLAAVHFAAALDGEDSDARHAVVLADWAIADLRRGLIAGATDKAERAVAAAKASGSVEALARGANAAGLIALEGDRTNDASRFFDTALAAIEGASDDARIAILNNLARTHLRAERVEAAVERAAEALAACVEVGDRHLEGALRSNLADALRAAGRSDESKEQLVLSAAILAEITANTDELEPELWRLNSW